MEHREDDVDAYTEPSPLVTSVQDTKMDSACYQAEHNSTKTLWSTIVS